MRAFRYLVVGIVFLAVSQTVNAQGKHTLNRLTEAGVSTETSKRFAATCGLDAKYKGDQRSDDERKNEIALKAKDRLKLKNAKFFKESGKAAAQIISDYCAGGEGSDFNVYARLKLLVEKMGQEGSRANIAFASNEANPDRLVSIQRLTEILMDDIDLAERNQRDHGAAALDSITVMPQSSRSPVLLAAGQNQMVMPAKESEASASAQADCDAAVKSVVPESNCNQYMAEFAEIYGQVQALYASKEAEEAAQTLRVYSAQWKTFMEETVDQTPLELWWNGYRHRKKHKGYRALLPPPKWQHIFLKPYIAGDYNGEAPDGSQLKEAVVLDVWGFKLVDLNKDAKWYVPKGYSVHLAASDREGVNDWGIGLSVHLNDRNTIGVTDYDGDVGVFLSFDLWKNATDKYDTVQTRVDNYRKTAKSIAADPGCLFKEEDDPDRCEIPSE